MTDKRREFGLRIGRLELRNYQNPQDKPRDFELVEWAQDLSHCWVLAFLEWGKEGYDLRSVGMRPWDSKRDVPGFMRAASGLLDYAARYYLRPEDYETDD